MNQISGFAAFSTHTGLSGIFDGKVRLKATDLERAQLSHNFSFLDHEVQLDAPGNCRAGGSTEWTGRFAGRSVSLGWDWYLDTRHRLYVLKCVLPRSNICVISKKGYDMEDREGSELIFEVLKKDFWHASVHEVCWAAGVKPSH